VINIQKFDKNLFVPKISIMRIKLKCIEGIYKGLEAGLEKGTLSIGRLSSNSIVLHPEDALASRKHAIIQEEHGKYFLIDQKSTNGTYLNGRRISPLKKYPLTTGDKVRIGSSTFIVKIEETGKSLVEEVFGKLQKQVQTFQKQQLQGLSQQSKSQQGQLRQRKPQERQSQQEQNVQSVSQANDQVSQLKVLEKIAEGGMSRIYKAVFLDTKRIVAIKQPKPEYKKEPEILDLFRKEIQITLHLKHPNIIETLYSITFEGLPTMVMEYFPSEPLSSLIKKNDLPLSIKLKIFNQTCDALEYTHRRNIIHNDIKPGNILVGKDYLIKITDFGTGGTPASLKTTKDKWRILGTLLYMSPEQINGENISFSSDIYALGILLYELLAGVNPFRKEGANEPAQIIERQLKYTPPPPSELNSSLDNKIDDIVMKALEKKPDKRYFDVVQFKRNLNEAMK